MARVLLVEDEAAIAVLLVDVLEEAGHEVVDALNGADAETALQNWAHLLDVLVTDINVQTRGWGFGFAARARELNPRLAVIYITGDSEISMDSEGVPGGVALPKPFLPSDLVAAVERLVRST